MWVFRDGPALRARTQILQGEREVHWRSLDKGTYSLCQSWMPSPVRTGGKSASSSSLSDAKVIKSDENLTAMRQVLSVMPRVALVLPHLTCVTTPCIEIEVCKEAVASFTIPACEEGVVAVYDVGICECSCQPYTLTTCNGVM